MANRSYLFATDAYDVPQDVFNAIGMSEFAYDIHPLYKLLVSRESKIVDSYIWKQEDIGIIGDLDQGKEIVISFLRMLNELDPTFQTPEFEKFISDTVDFLGKRNEKYAFLEGGEIYDMEEGDLKERCKIYFDSIKESGKEVISLLEKNSHGKLNLAGLSGTGFFGDFIKIITQSGGIEINKIDWKDFWSTILYYDLRPKMKE